MLVYQRRVWPSSLDVGLLDVFTPTVGVVRSLMKPRTPSGKIETHGVGYYGRWGCADADVYPNTEVTDLNFSTSPWSMWCAMRVTIQAGTGDFPGIFGVSKFVSGSDNQGMNWYINGGSGSGGFFSLSVGANNGNYDCFSLTKATVGEWTLGGCSDGTNRYVYINGRQENSTSQNPTPVAQTTNGLAFGEAASPTPGVYVGAFWNRCLQAEEMRWLHQNVQVFASRREGLFRRPVATVSAVTTAQLVGVFDAQRSSQMIGLQWR